MLVIGLWAKHSRHQEHKLTSRYLGILVVATAVGLLCCWTCLAEYNKHKVHHLLTYLQLIVGKRVSITIFETCRSSGHKDLTDEN